jgi:hypothetical protein
MATGKSCLHSQKQRSLSLVSLRQKLVGLCLVPPLLVSRPIARGQGKSSLHSQKHRGQGKSCLHSQKQRSLVSRPIAKGQGNSCTATSLYSYLNKNQNKGCLLSQKQRCGQGKSSIRSYICCLAPALPLGRGASLQYNNCTTKNKH